MVSTTPQGLPTPETSFLWSFPDFTPAYRTAPSSTHTQTSIGHPCLWPACDFFNLLRRMQHNDTAEGKHFANFSQCRHKESEWVVNMGSWHPQLFYNTHNTAFCNIRVGPVTTQSILMLKARNLISGFLYAYVIQTFLLVYVLPISSITSYLHTATTWHINFKFNVLHVRAPYHIK
jgi:hypothetical protein